tara:strand:+ start:1942 stop:3840 length:1899 start_codon:yes stop_codon:yes gene_type:complete
MGRAIFWPGMALALVLLVTFWAYWPGVSGPALLDDFSSLEKLEALSDSSSLAMDYILGERSGPLGRGVSMATFVVDRWFGDGGGATSKAVNICLHLLVTICVFGFLLLLLRAWRLSHAGLVAALFSGFWALAPLQVSTVLYTVQRMAMLAALFSLMSLSCYLLWRRTLALETPRHGWIALAAVFFLLGVFSKENALVVIPLVLVTELCWLQYLDGRGRVMPGLRRASLVVFWLGLLLAVLLLLASWAWLEARYAHRDFRLEQRLFTQPRILWDYVRQFYWPDMARLGVYHDDYPLSVSLTQPNSTLPALVAWLLVLLGASLSWRWSLARRVSYGVLFFLVSHSLESTAWPLELYFEHRNYLASVGLVLIPLSLYAYASARWPILCAPTLAWVSVTLVVFLVLTASQVQIWSQPVLLAFQHVNGHPESARANRELASRFAAVGEHDLALQYSKEAYLSSLGHAAAGDEHHGDYVLRNVALACIAGNPLQADAFTRLGSVSPDRPLGDVNTLSVVVKLREKGVCPSFDWAGFLSHLRNLYLNDFDTQLASANMFTTLAMLANAEANWQDAFQYTKRSLALAPGRARELLMQLHFATALGDDLEGARLMNKLEEMASRDQLNRGQYETLKLYRKE